MSLKRSNGPFRSITSVDIWWHKLVIVTLLLSYSTFVLYTGLIVENLEVDEHPIIEQASHDGLVSLQAMLVLASLEWVFFFYFFFCAGLRDPTA